MDAKAALAAALAVAFAGCSSPPDGRGAEPCAATPCTSSSASSAPSDDLEGIVVGLVHVDEGTTHRLDATVRNTGFRIVYYLWVPQCGLEPWHEGMEGPDGPVLPREPEAHCEPCGWDALSPGESLSKSYGWDERVWDYDGQRLRDAPDGRYTWTVTFRAEPDEDVCGGDRSVSASVEVDVG